MKVHYKDFLYTTTPIDKIMRKWQVENTIAKINNKYQLSHLPLIGASLMHNLLHKPCKREVPKALVRKFAT